MAVRIFQEVFSEGGKLLGITGESSAPSVEVGAEGASNHAAGGALGAGCEDVVPCRNAWRLGSTPGCQPRVTAFHLNPPE